MIVASGIVMQFGAKPFFADVSVKFGGGKILGGELERRAGLMVIECN